MVPARAAPHTSTLGRLKENTMITKILKYAFAFISISNTVCYSVEIPKIRVQIASEKDEPSTDLVVSEYLNALRSIPDVDVGSKYPIMQPIFL